MLYCTPWKEKACAKECESDRAPFPVRPDVAMIKLQSCPLKTSAKSTITYFTSPKLPLTSPRFSLRFSDFSNVSVFSAWPD